MGRIFLWLAASAVLAILMVGGGVYALSSIKIAKVKQESAGAVANAVALTLSQQISLLNRTLNKMAQDPAVVNALVEANPMVLEALAGQLERYFPDALKIRLLMPGVSELDETTTPRMGFADLDMVRETFANEQSPGIQGYEGADKHLAITARIKQNDQVVGVILASLNYDFFTKSLQSAAVQNGLIELKQADLVLGSSGRMLDDIAENTVQATVAGTGWVVYHHYAVGTDLADMSLTVSCIVVPALLTILVFLFGHRRFSDVLAHDLDTLLMACKTMVANKKLGSYPATFAEISAIISSLVQFKRTYDHKQHEATFKNSDDLDLAGLERFGLNSLSLEADHFIDFTSTTPADDGNEPPQTLPVIEAAVVSEDSRSYEYEMTPTVVMDDDFNGLFKSHYIAGVADKTLTKERMYDVGRAIGTAALEYGCKTIVVGRDGRLSSPGFAESIAHGIVSTGLDVLDIGQVPTPMLYFVTQHTEGRSGVMVTASHKPADYNGVKMIVNGETLADHKIQQIKTCIASQNYTIGDMGMIERNTAYVQEYIGTISEDIHIARPMLVVLDCGNGIAGELGPHLLQALGCEVVELYCEVDGNFPNHNPDPSKTENLAELIASVKHYKADLGIAFDGDGDRLGVVDSNGHIIWPDRQMMLFAKDILAKRPGAGIIYDVKCTRHLGEEIAKLGGEPILWKTGDASMRNKLKELGAALAGELSGHIFFNDRWFGFADALYAAARLIEILSGDSRSSAEIFAQFPESYNASEWSIVLKEGENSNFMASLLAEADFTGGKVTTVDGLRVDFASCWGLVKASKTSPAVIVRLEADDKDALLFIQDQFRQLLEKIKPDIVLPF